MTSQEPGNPDATRIARIRSTTASRTSQSKREAPHFYLDADVDMAAVGRLRGSFTDDPAWPDPPSYTAIIVHTVAQLLGERPELNVRFDQDGPIAIEGIGVGVAVDTPAGLLVPVLPDADTSSLRGIADWLKGAADRACRLRLRPEDLSPKSLVVSNLGPLGIDRFHAIIDPSDPMILAVGRTIDRVVVERGLSKITPMATFSLSIDHRVLDGADGARFLSAFRERVESIDAARED